MSSQVTLAALSNREDYIESFEAFDENGAAVDLTGATIVYAAADTNCSPVLSASTADGKITISTTVATITIPHTEIRGVEPKSYNVGCTIDLNGVVKQFFVGTITIYDGVVR